MESPTHPDVTPSDGGTFIEPFVSPLGLYRNLRNELSIQRSSTVRGIAPTTPCDSSNLGSISQVPYTAQYVFYRSRRTKKSCNATARNRVGDLTSSRPSLER